MDKQQSQTNEPAKEDVQIIRVGEVMKLTGFSRSSVYRLETTDENFPKKVKIGPKAVGWIKQEILNWLSPKIENRK
ncbi:helix-turn-helix transcriptional regulator [Vibrio diazotrophicus]|uniref:helix-turn-helix transcriptional regulator n=1 Tax=Vibrio diazotrophicus TaxID=685 RepID=UPI003D2F9706